MRRRYKDRQAAIAASVLPPGLRNVGLDQKLNEQVPLDLEFSRRSRAARCRFPPISARKPVILALVYYQCPMLCTQILNGLVMSLRGMSLESGRDFEVVTVSIDPTETPDLAARKKAEYLRRYGQEFGRLALPHRRRTADQATGPLPSASATPTTPRPNSTRMPAPSWCSRPAAGFRDISTESNMLRAICASAWSKLPKTRSVRRSIRSLLYCYHYDPNTGKYSAIVMNIVRLAGALTLLISDSVPDLALAR